MSRALAWIRKSKGSDDDIGLEMQRSDVPALAEDLAEEVDVLDLGVHTGFSTLSRDDEGMLDDHEDVQAAVDELRAGKYDFLVAVDDRRICRDDYLSIIEYACVQGDCEIVFVSDDVADDDLAYDIHRRVERETKEEEIRKSKAAIRERQERGMWQGAAPVGLQFDENGEYLVPDDDFEDVMAVFERVDEETYGEIASDLGVGKGTVSRIVDRGREFYESRAEGESPA
jgi:hypothetical protein